jgi:hypothetical protein
MYQYTIKILVYFDPIEGKAYVSIYDIYKGGGAPQ